MKKFLASVILCGFLAIGSQAYGQATAASTATATGGSATAGDAGTATGGAATATSGAATATSTGGAGGAGAGGSATAIEVNNIDKHLLGLVPAPVVNPKFTNQRAGDIKTKGSLWDIATEVTAAEISSILPEFFGTDAEVTVRARKTDVATGSIVLAKEKIGDCLGVIYVTSTGADAIAVEAAAIKEAMRIGGTHIIKGASGTKVVAKGSAVNIGLGGGASFMNNAEDIGVAPSGGLGWGEASASSDVLPQAMFIVYRDPASVPVVKPVNDGTFKGPKCSFVDLVNGNCR